MADFRIMPARHFERVRASCTRYGFIIPNHPLGVEHDGALLKAGEYCATWETIELATAAAHCLGISTREIMAVPTLIPDEAAI